MHRKGLRKCDILRTLLVENSFSIDIHNLSRFIRRYEETGELRKIYSPRCPTKLTDEIMEFVDQAMEKNDETTAEDLVQMILDQLETKISATTIKRARFRLGWFSTGTKYCQLVREANRVKRLEYCQRLLATNEQFNDVIFSDESTIALESHAKITFHRWWEPPGLKGRVKHPVKVHVWSGISRCGVTEMAIFTGIMEATFLQNQFYVCIFFCSSKEPIQKGIGLCKTMTRSTL